MKNIKIIENILITILSLVVLEMIEFFGPTDIFRKIIPGSMFEYVLISLILILIILGLAKIILRFTDNKALNSTKNTEGLTGQKSVKDRYKKMLFLIVVLSIVFYLLYTYVIGAFF